MSKPITTQSPVIIESLPGSAAPLATLPPRQVQLGDANAGLAPSDTATLDAEIHSGLTHMDEANKLRETVLGSRYALAVHHFGRALIAAVRVENMDSRAAVLEVRKRVMAAARARTETPRQVIFHNSGIAQPRERWPKPTPGTYIQAYTRVLDLSRWTPGVDMYRLDTLAATEGSDKPGLKVGKPARGRPENPVSLLPGYAGIPVQGTMYTSPVDALRDGRTLESVHQAWVNVVRPTVIDFDTLPDARPAVEAQFGRMFVTIRYQGKGEKYAGKKRVKIAEHHSLLGAVILAALKTADRHGWRERMLAVVEKYEQATRPEPEPKPINADATASS